MGATVGEVDIPSDIFFNLSGFIQANDAITTDPRQRHRRHQLDGRGVLAFLCRNVGNTWRGLMRGHAWVGVKTMVLMSALLVAVACGGDDGPTAPTRLPESNSSHGVQPAARAVVQRTRKSG